LVRQRPFDLVLMDHMMPVMDGVAATRAVRRMDEERCRTLPVVALTAGAVSGMREMFLENGFNDVLAKPIDIGKLDAVLKQWIPVGKRLKAPPDGTSENAFREPLHALPPLVRSGQGPTASFDADARPCPPQSSSARSGQSPGVMPYTAEESYPHLYADAGRRQEFARADEHGKERAPLYAPPEPSLPTIAGVDTALGLTRIGGSQRRYLQLLAVFRPDAEACLARIAEQPDETSLPAFTTQAHAVKSALANIGADGLSKEAALLEKAGKEADMPLIRKTLPVFREELAALAARVGEALAPDSAPAADVAEEPDPDVAGHLEALRDALETVDIDAADAALARLQTLSLPAALRDAVTETAEHMLTADFDKAAETVAGLLGRKRR
ncbi:MAG: response regulator, partial [Desulfovibrio sp.]|nr:response regulator [Desulfovibrio sp.]